MIESKSNAPIELCWRKLDSQSKKLDFHFTRNLVSSGEKADVEVLDSISDDLEIIQTEMKYIQNSLSRKSNKNEEVYSINLKETLGN